MLSLTLATLLITVFLSRISGNQSIRSSWPAAVSAAVAAAAAGDSGVIFPGQQPPTICQLPDCRCEPLMKHSARAQCECHGKALQLNASQFGAVSNVSELVVIGSRDCHSVTVSSQTFSMSSVKRVNISAPTKVILKPRSFHAQQRRRGSFSVNIEHATELQLSSHAFSGAVSQVSITSIDGPLRLSSKTFVRLADTDVRFRRVVIEAVEPDAFFHGQLARLSFSDAKIHLIAAGAVRNSDVAQLQLLSCHLQLVEADAVQARVGDLTLKDSSVGELRTDALRVSLAGTARLTGNTFLQMGAGALAAVEPRSRRARLDFHNNSLHVLQEGALRFSREFGSGQLSMNGLRSGRPCHCGLLRWLQTLAPRRQLAETLAAVTSCLPDCPTVSCQPDGDPAPVSIGRYTRNVCSGRRDDAGDAANDNSGGGGGGGGGSGGSGRPGRQRAALLAGGAVAVLFITSCTTGLVCWRLGRRRRHRRQRRRAEANVLSHRPHKLNNANISGGGEQRWSQRSSGPPPASPLPAGLVVAVPDVKTYTETELHVVLESLELLPEGALTPTADGCPEPADAGPPGCRKSCPL